MEFILQIHNFSTFQHTSRNADNFEEQRRVEVPTLFISKGKKKKKWKMMLNLYLTSSETKRLWFKHKTKYDLLEGESLLWKKICKNQILFGFNLLREIKNI